MAAFIAGAFVASPELRAYAANTVGSADIINNSIQSVDIKDGEVKAADIATDTVGASEIALNAVGAAEIAANSVGASEITGVSTLVFRECRTTSNTSVPPGGIAILVCGVAGVGSGDVAVATIGEDGSNCFAINKAEVITNAVRLTAFNSCSVNDSFGTGTIAIIVFDTGSLIIPVP